MSEALLFGVGFVLFVITSTADAERLLELARELRERNFMKIVSLAQEVV